MYSFPLKLTEYRVWVSAQNQYFQREIGSILIGSSHTIHTIIYYDTSKIGMGLGMPNEISKRYDDEESVRIMYCYAVFCKASVKRDTWAPCLFRIMTTVADI